MKDSLEKHRATLWILAFALLVRLVALAGFAGLELETDDRAYYDYAVRMYEGQGFVNETGEPTAYFPPGYPLALTVWFKLVGGPSVPAAQALNMILSMVLLISLYALALNLFSPRVARVTLFLMAIYPPQIIYSVIVWSEMISTALLLAGFALVLYRKPPVLAGLLIGGALLARPQNAVFVALFAAWYIWQERDYYVQSIGRGRDYLRAVGRTKLRRGWQTRAEYEQRD